MQQKPTAEALLFHEDMEVGKDVVLGSKTLTKDEIIAFARAYDPQPMHLDEEAARHTLVGGLCASGFHTCAIMMRLACDGILNRVASLGSPGVDEVKWMKPVRPDDRHTAVYRVLEKRDLASRADVGLSKVIVELSNEKGERAASWVSSQFTRRRNPGPPVARTEQKPQANPALPDLWSGPAVPAGATADAYFEDREIGETTSYEGYTFGRDEIIDFARQFDPQPFHLDEEAAKASLFGALCASGWHTAAIFIRGVVRARMAGNARAREHGERLPSYGPSPGFRNLRWFKPVYAGDSIEFRARLAQKVDLKSRPNRGLIVNDVQGRNQKGEIVFAITSQILAERREPYRAPA